MMWKLIFLGLIVWFAVYVFKRVISQNGSQADKRKPSSEEKAAGDNDIESMVKCATCAVHLPRSEAFLVNGNFYCSKAHIQNK